MLGREAAWLIVPVIAEEGEHRETVPLENPQQQNVPGGCRAHIRVLILELHLNLGKKGKDSEK